VNYTQIPVNTPKVVVHSYSKDGAMRIRNVTDPVYAPNSVGGPQADPARAAEVHWAADGEMVRAAYTLRQNDDDFGQPGTLVREVLDDQARDRLAHNIIGQSSRRQRAGAVPGVRVLEERGPRSRQDNRGRRTRQPQRQQRPVTYPAGPLAN
jgi:catalase